MPAALVQKGHLVRLVDGLQVEDFEVEESERALTNCLI